MNHLLYKSGFEHVKQLVTHRPGISLANIVRNYHLLSKMKVVLAFILAHSLRGYYDSGWMNTKWCSQTVHLIEENGLMAMESKESCLQISCTSLFTLATMTLGLLNSVTLTERYTTTPGFKQHRAYQISILVFFSRHSSYPLECDLIDGRDKVRSLLINEEEDFPSCHFRAFR